MILEEKHRLLHLQKPDIVALGAYICNTHNDLSNILSFNMQTRNLKEIQSDAPPDNRVLVRIPKPTWADIDPQYQSHVFLLKKLQQYRDDIALLP